MTIRQLIWPIERVEHIARHGVRTQEVEEVCSSRPLAWRVWSKGKNPVYHVLGRTRAGRFLFCVVIEYPDGNGYPVTARPMTDKERRRFNRWRQP